MKNLSLDPLINNTDTDFLNGKIDNGITKPNEHIHQDIIQFFQKLAAITNTVPNDLFDNETNDYQLIDALRKYISFASYILRQPIGWDFVETDLILDGNEHDLVLDQFIINPPLTNNVNDVKAVVFQIVLSTGIATADTDQIGIILQDQGETGALVSQSALTQTTSTGRVGGYFGQQTVKVTDGVCSYSIIRQGTSPISINLAVVGYYL